jgi:hypothetical protein
MTFYNLWGVRVTRNSIIYIYICIIQPKFIVLYIYIYIYVLDYTAILTYLHAHSLVRGMGDYFFVQNALHCPHTGLKCFRLPFRKGSARSRYGKICIFQSFSFLRSLLFPNVTVKYPLTFS